VGRRLNLGPIALELKDQALERLDRPDLVGRDPVAAAGLVEHSRAVPVVDGLVHETSLFSGSVRRLGRTRPNRLTLPENKDV
jgi:hypothetical protein